MSVWNAESLVQDGGLQRSANLRTFSLVTQSPKAQLGLDTGYLSVYTEPHGDSNNLN